MNKVQRKNFARRVREVFTEVVFELKLERGLVGKS